MMKVLITTAVVPCVLATYNLAYQKIVVSSTATTNIVGGSAANVVDGIVSACSSTVSSDTCF